MRPRILFMGTPEFAVGILDALIASGWPIVGVVTQPDRQTGRKRDWTAPPVKVAARAQNIPVLQPERIRDEQAWESISLLQPELIITAAYGQLIPTALLDLPQFGALNVHASLLPFYRGGAPIQWVLMHGERETGVTIMTMVKKMDAGPMWARTVVPIGADTTYGELHNLLIEAGARLLVNVLPEILAGQIVPEEQCHEQATFAPTLTRADELLDFRQDATILYNRIRALCPKPGTYTWMGDKQVKIWYATPDYAWCGNAEPGSVVGIDDAGPLIACGSGALVVHRMQLAGRGVQSGREFARGIKDFQKMKFSSEKAVAE